MMDRKVSVQIATRSSNVGSKAKAARCRTLMMSASAVALILGAQPLLAATRTWNPTVSDSNFLTAANWGGTVPTAGDIANILVATPAGSPVLGGAASMAQVAINNNVLTVTAAGVLTVTTSTAIQSATGTLVNAGTVSSVATTNAGSIVNSGLFISTTGNSGALTNLAAGTMNGVLTNTGTAANAGRINGAVISTNSLNNTGIINGAVTNSGVFNQTATGSIANSGGLTNAGTAFVAGAISGVIQNNAGVVTVTGNLLGDNAFNNVAGATLNISGGNYTGVTTLTSAGNVNVSAGRTLQATAAVNNTATGVIANAGTLTTPVLTNAGIVTNAGQLNGTLTNNATGLVGNIGTINGAISNAGTLITTGVTQGGLTNAGTVFAAGTVSGLVQNNAGVFTVTGNLSGDNAFNNVAGATLNVSGGSYTGLTTLTNAGNVNVSAGQTLQATAAVNNAVGGVIANAGTLTTPVLTNAGIVTNAGQLNGALTNNATGLVGNTGTINGAISNAGTLITTGVTQGGLTNAGTVFAAGAISGIVTNNNGVFTVTGNLAGDNNFDNNAGAFLNVSGGSYTGINTLINLGNVNIATARTLEAFSISNSFSGVIANAGTLNGTGPFSNIGTITNSGQINASIFGISNTFGGIIGNTGTINGRVDNGINSTFINTGVLQGPLTNSGTVFAQGIISGAVFNGNGVLTVTGNLVGDNTFRNVTGANLNVSNGNYTGITTLTNTGNVNIATTRTLGSMIGFVNDAGGVLANAGTLIAPIVTNTGTIANAGQINGALTNNATGLVGNTGTINGTINNAGTLVTTGATQGGLTNTGTVFASGSISGPVQNNGGVITVTGNLVGDSTFNNQLLARLDITGGNYSGLTNLVNSGQVNIAANRILSAVAVSNNPGGVLSNNGTLNASTVTNSRTLSNVGQINGALTNNAPGTVGNTGTINGAITNSGTIITTGTTQGGLTNTGTVFAAGTVGGPINNNGGVFTVTGNLAGDSTFTNAAGARFDITGGNYANGTALVNSGIVNVGGPARTLTTTSVNNLATGVLANLGVINAATISNVGTMTNGGQLNSVTLFNNLGGILGNSGTINASITNTGTLTTTGTLTGNLANGGSVFAAGTINSPVQNNAGVFTTIGNLLVNGAFTNDAGAFLNTTGGDYSGLTALTNAGNVNISATRTLSAGSVTNTSVLANAGSLVAPVVNNTAGATLISTGNITAGTSFTNAGSANLQGALNTPLANNSGTLNVTGALGGATTTFTNTGGVTLGGDFTGIGTFNNAGTVSSAGNRILGAATFNNQATGLVTMQNGSVTDNLTVNGSFIGTAGSRVAVDVDLSQNNTSQRGDKLTATGAGSGTTNVSFNFVNGLRAAFTTPIDVLQVAPGSTLNVNQGLIASAGFFNYFLKESTPGSGLFQVASQFNSAPLMGVASGVNGVVGSLQAGFHQPASAIVSRPDSCTPNQFMGGPFIRLSTGKTSTDLGGSGDIAGGGSPFTAQTKTDSRFSGFQVGADFGVCNIQNTNWNLNFGLMGGLVTAKSTSNSRTPSPVVGGADLRTSTSSDVDVPFIGIYSFLTNGPFTFEVNLRKDFYSAKITTPDASTSSFFVGPDTKLKGQGLSFNTSMSYRFNFAERWYIEPAVGFSKGSTKFGNLRLATSATDALIFDTTDSLLGRIGINIGAAFSPTESLIVVPFATASVWREMGESATAHAIVGAAGQTFNVRTDRVGTFGQVGAGVQFKIVGTPLLGFVRGDVRFGQKIDGKAVNAGLRMQF
jgi:fibronectin-binding autotransporter adhesin